MFESNDSIFETDQTKSGQLVLDNSEEGLGRRWFVKILGFLDKQDSLIKSLLDEIKKQGH